MVRFDFYSQFKNNVEQVVPQLDGLRSQDGHAAKD